MAPYNAGAIAGMVLVALVTIVIILMFVNSTVFHMLALTSFLQAQKREEVEEDPAEEEGEQGRGTN